MRHFTKGYRILGRAIANCCGRSNTQWFPLRSQKSFSWGFISSTRNDLYTRSSFIADLWSTAWGLLIRPLPHNKSGMKDEVKRRHLLSRQSRMTSEGYLGHAGWRRKFAHRVAYE